MPATAAPQIWALSDDRIGMVNQVVGLCERLEASFGITWQHKIVTVTGFGKIWPTGLQAFLPLHLTRPSRAALAAPLPDMVIGCGRSMIPLLLRFKRLGVKTVYLQDPRIQPSHFDLVIAPDHDKVSGPNVIKTIGSIHRVTPERLAAEIPTIHAAKLGALGQPRLGVLIGGDNNHLALTEARAAEIAARLSNLARSHGYSLMVTASRRTSPAALTILRQTLEDIADCYFWDATGANPYFDILNHADMLIVTEDSVNMASEAAATGKPVFICELERKRRLKGLLPPRRALKFDQFHKALLLYGVARPLPPSGPLVHWDYLPLDPAGEALPTIAALLPTK